MLIPTLYPKTQCVSSKGHSSIQRKDKISTLAKCLLSSNGPDSKVPKCLNNILCRCFFFLIDFVVLGFELRVYTLNHSTSDDFL
jgi:hypothetical protein